MTYRIDTFVASVCNEQIEILFQDEHILLINKPSGLLSLSGKNPANKDSVHFRLVQQYPAINLVHRLDFGTSGMLVLALTKAVNTHLSKQFEERTVVKTYISVLNGHVATDEGNIDASIAKDSAIFPKLKVCELNGKQASSQYKVLKRLQNPQRTRVQFTPLTGRTHQLRIHSQQIGHPILGCDLYGTTQTQAMADRLLLHAATLEFDHPVTGERILGECPCPF